MDEGEGWGGGGGRGDVVHVNVDDVLWGAVVTIRCDDTKPCDIIDIALLCACGKERYRGEGKGWTRNGGSIVEEGRSVRGRGDP